MLINLSSLIFAGIFPGIQADGLPKGNLTLILVRLLRSEEKTSAPVARRFGSHASGVGYRQ